jgi:hypothetical protein
MRRYEGLVVLCALLVTGSLARSSLATEFTRDGTIALDSAQIGNTSDGENPGRSWLASLSLPAPVVIAAGDVLQGTVSFGGDLLRLSDDGGGFFTVGAEQGFEQLIVRASDGGSVQNSQVDAFARFTDVRGPALQTGGMRVGGISFSGLFIQVVVDMVSPGEDIFASGVTYRLGLVSGGPFTLDTVTLRVLAEDIGIEPRSPGDLAYRHCLTGETESGPTGTRACEQIGSSASFGVNSGLDNLRSIAVSADGASLYVVSGADDAVARFDRDSVSGALVYQDCITGEADSGATGTNACVQIATATPGCRSK